MKPPKFDNRLLPLSTEKQIEERVAALIGRASRRQIWFLFVDEHDDQLPLLIPIEGQPSRPHPRDAERFAALLTDVHERAGARGVIMVIERYGSAELSDSDVEWAKVLHEAAVASGLVMRGVFVSHAKGVRRAAPDDYLFVADGPVDRT